MSPLLTTFKHEWATHGTCYSTLKQDCLPRGSPRGTEAVLYFQRVVELFRKLPTYDWLALSGINPSQTRTHTLSEVINALKEASGVCCMLFCSTVVLKAKLSVVYPGHQVCWQSDPRDLLVFSYQGLHHRRRVRPYRWEEQFTPYEVSCLRPAQTPRSIGATVHRAGSVIIPNPADENNAKSWSCRLYSTSLDSIFYDFAEKSYCVPNGKLKPDVALGRRTVTGW